MCANFSKGRNYQLNDGKSKRKLFPQVLHEFVSDPLNNDSITWLPHGRSFMILNRDKLESDLLKSKHFKLTKVRSFIRQLNGWGYHRVAKGNEKGSYFHAVR